MPALPSAGRDLIPYFSSPEECIDETLSQTKTEAARFAFPATCAHVLPQPVPNIVHLYLYRKRKKLGRRFPAVSASLAPSTSLAISPPKVNSPRKSVAKRMVQKRPEDSRSSTAKSNYAQASGTNPYGVAAGNARSSLPLTSKDLKAWAGPSYYTSPPPEHLPMPTSFLLAV